MNITKHSIVGSIVAEDYRAAGVFEQSGIDFCCNGNQTIEAACSGQNIAADKLISSLNTTLTAPARKDDARNSYTSWPLDLLADHIEKKHHRYVTEQLPVIHAFLEKIVRVHGQRHPELTEIQDLFHAVGEELTAHMTKEERMLFPYIRKMVQARLTGSRNVAAPFGSIQNPIRMMMQEHDTEGKRFQRIKELSNQYVAPDDGCSTYRTAYAMLQEFEEDLHLHIHLENNILFPRAIEFEQSFS